MMKYRRLKRKQAPKNGVQYIISNAVRQELKPLVFFDGGKFERNDDGFTVGYHPHSGIGIITYFHGTDLHHKDSAMHYGVINDGGVQWISAGKGIWHEEGYHRKADDASKNNWTGTILQLWLQLPAEWEESDAEYLNVPQEEIAEVGEVKVITGRYGNLDGSIKVPVNMTYLDVSLKKGEQWFFDTPAKQTTGFMFTRDGGIQVGEDALEEGEMGILEHNDGRIEVTAISNRSNFILVIAEPSVESTIARNGQIHTNEAALERSYKHIVSLGKALKW